MKTEQPNKPKNSFAMQRDRNLGYRTALYSEEDSCAVSWVCELEAAQGHLEKAMEDDSIKGFNLALGYVVLAHKNTSEALERERSRSHTVPVSHSETATGTVTRGEET